MLNLGGGFPTRYRTDVPAIEACADAVMKAVTRHFGNDLPDMIVEPGRALVGAAGVIQSRGRADLAQGLRRPQALGLSRHRQVRRPRRDHGRGDQVSDRHASATAARPARSSSPARPATAPTSSTRTRDYRLPLDLKVGDKVAILGTGAYTSTYSSVGFNGFAPLQTYCI